MVEYVNVVVCKHPNLAKEFIFRAPDSSNHVLNVGDYVLCHTCRGPGQIARCVTPEFRIADFQLKEFYNVTIDKLAPVTAYLKPIVFTHVHVKEDAHGEDGQSDPWSAF